ncbi:peroxiredoxin [Rugosimonospora africana]|uniref:thioredoxin-dependent peroxiredoxin n=1 Tax=Rugosimonospora africana TaxID=556532 RepID=A0A8J3QXI3_9ACTN|nr:peroxiredoxin [Rugosimonospora africana]
MASFKRPDFAAGQTWPRAVPASNLLPVANVNSLAVGDRAPDFTLPTQTGEQVSLHDLLKERVVVLYFYPKDDTLGCTREACAFRDAYEVFVEAGAQVVGISSDSVGSHDQFARKHNLPFVLVADEGGEVRRSFGVRSTLGFLPGRVTYVIDRQGIIRYVFSSQTQFNNHVQGALAVVRQLTGMPA